MQESENTQRDSEKPAEEALSWIARLRSDACTDEDRQDFALWLASDPAHGRIMDRMLDMWDDLAVVRELPLRSEPAEPQRRRWLAGGLAIAASLALAVLLMPQMTSQPKEQIYQTRVGEQMQVQLADGSRVLLNTHSTLRVNLNDSRRSLELLRGEVFFEVSRDEDRPFVVKAGDTRVTVLGTAFNIFLDQGTSHIIVTEGVVEVSELSPPQSRPADTEILRANQGLSGDSTGLAPSFSANPEVELAWRQGKLVADGMSLRELALELSRYHPHRIVITDPAVAQLTVSGAFRLENPDAILSALEHSVGVRRVELDDGSIQLIRAPL